MTILVALLCLAVGLIAGFLMGMRFIARRLPKIMAGLTAEEMSTLASEAGKIRQGQ